MLHQRRCCICRNDLQLVECGGNLLNLFLIKIGIRQKFLSFECLLEQGIIERRAGDRLKCLDPGVIVLGVTIDFR
jgi:hypothetical protein